MAKKMEVREGDYLTVRLPVRVARDEPLDDQIVTLELFGQRISGPLGLAPGVKHEKGVNWPG